VTDTLTQPFSRVPSKKSKTVHGDYFTAMASRLIFKVSDKEMITILEFFTGIVLDKEMITMLSPCSLLLLMCRANCYYYTVRHATEEKRQVASLLDIHVTKDAIFLFQHSNLRDLNSKTSKL
jgi:hypothetical protein